MAEPMSMNKIIHAAVRRDLARFGNALAAFPAGNKARAVRLATAWKFFYGEVDNHHRGEHEIAWPTLLSLGVRQATLDEMDAEHERLADALSQADFAFTALEKSPTDVAAKSAATAIADLDAVVAEHFKHEERELEPVFQAKRGTPELKAMGRKFARRNPVLAGDFFAWVLNGATDEQKVALRDEVPAPVVAIFGNVFGQRYRRIVAPVWR
jgi:hypothetical protein